MAKQKCEGCRKPATTEDVEGVPLCQACHDAADHADTCKCPPCLEKRIEVAEVKTWRTWNDRDPHEPDRGIEDIENARAATDDSGVLQLYSKPAGGGAVAPLQGAGS